MLKSAGRLGEVIRSSPGLLWLLCMVFLPENDCVVSGYRQLEGLSEVSSRGHDLKVRKLRTI